MTELSVKQDEKEIIVVIEGHMTVFYLQQYVKRHYKAEWRLNTPRFVAEMNKRVIIVVDKEYPLDLIREFRLPLIAMSNL